MSTKNGDKYISYTLFFATIAMMLGLISVVYNHTKNLPEDVAIIKTDVSWIKATLSAPEAMRVPEDADFADKVFAPEPTAYEPEYKPVYKQPLAQIIVPEEPIELKVMPISDDPAVIEVLESMGIATTTQAH